MKEKILKIAEEMKSFANKWQESENILRKSQDNFKKYNGTNGLLIFLMRKYSKLLKEATEGE